MSTSAEKAKRTRAKNLKKRAAEEKKLQLARARASRAEAKLKFYKEGFQAGIDSQK